MKKTYFLFVCLLACQLTLLSQPTEQLRIDSLRKVLPSLKNNARVDCLNELAAEHWHASRRDSMNHYALLAHEEAVKIGYSYGKAFALLKMADYELEVKKSLPIGKAYIDQVISIGETSKNDKILGWAHLTRAQLFGEKRDHAKLKECFIKSRDYFQKAGDKEGELEVTTWLCMLYVDEGKFEEGFDYCDKCVQLSNLVTRKSIAWHHELVQWSFTNMSEIYKTAGDYPTAMNYLKQCDEYAVAHNLGWDMDIGICEMYCRLGKYDSALLYWHRWEKDYAKYGPGHQAYGNNILAEIYFNTKRYDEALKLLEASNTTLNTGRRNVALLRSLHLTAKVYAEKKNWNAALKNVNEAFSMAKQENILPSVIDAHELLSRIYHQLGENDKAYLNLRQYTLLKDSILNRQFLWRLSTYKKAVEDEKKKGSIELLNKDNEIKNEQLEKEILLKNVLIAGLIALALIGAFIVRTFKLKQKNEKLQRGRLENELKVQQLESQKQHAELRQKSSDLEMQALRAQMSPHFIFNCLSSINRFILKNETETASDYLTRFSRLIRLVLSNSKRSLISLEDELEMIQLYIEMERLRFKNSFDFNFCFKNEIDVSAICIPPLLLQPFAENAIWHGLMNKDGHGQLDISFASDENTLICSITDNGVGRKKAGELKSGKDLQRKSMGLQITADRLTNFNKDGNSDTFFEIIDLYDSEGDAVGTKVIVKIRIGDRAQALVDEETYA